MGESKGSSAHAGASLPLMAALFVLGYGAFWSSWCNGPLSTVHLYRLTAGWNQVLLAQLVYLVGTAVGCLALRAFFRESRAKGIPALFGAGVYAATTLLCLAAEVVFADPLLGLAASCLLQFVMGVAAAFPFLFWLDYLLAVCRENGRVRCIVLLVVSQLVPTVSHFAITLLGNGRASAGLVFMVAATLMAAACQVAMARLGGGAKRPDGGDGAEERYRLTPHSTSMLVCFGLLWGLVCATSSSDAEQRLALVVPWSLLLTLITAVLIVVLLVRRRRADGGIVFGSLIRMSLVVSGIVLSLYPVLHVLPTGAFTPLASVVIILLEVSVTLFSLDVCHENALRIENVLPVNHALFVGAACVSTVLTCLVHACIGGQTAWELMAVFSTAAVVSVIPFLPSRLSGATALTLDELPENEDYGARLVRRGERMAARYGLVERETVVLKLVLRGLTRQEIARELNLSPWTVKDRVASIYKKTGAHSYKDLMVLAEGDE